MIFYYIFSYERGLKEEVLIFANVCFRLIHTGKTKINYNKCKRLRNVLTGTEQTGSVTRRSYLPRFLPWFLIEAEAGQLYAGPAAGFREGTVKPTTSRRLSHSSVTLTTHSDADTLPLPRTKMFPNSSTGVRVSRHG